MSAVAIPFDADLTIDHYEEHKIETVEKGVAVVKKGDWIVEGYAATDDIDSEDDRIHEMALQQGADSLQDYTTILFNHDKDRPIGSLLEASVREGRLFIKIRISKTEPKLWEQIKDGTINKFSVRGRILDVDREMSTSLGRWIRVIKSLRLFECSLVTIPANANAKTLRWYVAKALSEFLEQGGELPAEDSEASGGQTMATTKEEETLQPAEAPPVEETAEQPDIEKGQETASDDAQEEEVETAAEETATEGETDQSQTEEPAAEETTDDGFAIPMEDAVKSRIKQSIDQIDQLLVGASEAQKGVLGMVKSILDRVTAQRYTFDDISIADEAIKSKIVESRLGLIKSREMSEAVLLIEHAEASESDPVRKHFLKGVRMLLGETEVAKDAETSEIEEPVDEPVEKAETATDTESAVTDAITKVGEQIEALAQRISAIEDTAKTEETPEEETAEKAEEEAPEADPVEEPAEEQSTEKSEKVEESVEKAITEKLGELTKVLESFGARIEKIEKMEGVSQSIRGQDSSGTDGKSQVNGWMGVLAPGIAQAMGVTRPE